MEKKGVNNDLPSETIPPLVVLAVPNILPSFCLIENVSGKSSINLLKVLGVSSSLYSNAALTRLAKLDKWQDAIEKAKAILKGDK